MKKQKQGRLLCALCLALLLIPLAGMLLAGPSDAVSNERLAAKPRLMRGGKLNPDFLSETADYFAGHFYLRPALLTANGTVQPPSPSTTSSDADSRKTAACTVLFAVRSAGRR